MLPSVSDMCVFESASIRETLEKIDHNAQGICFVVKPSAPHVFVGVVTDGDIRRILLKNYSLEDGVSEIVNRAALSFSAGHPLEEVQEKLSTTVRHIPLLNDQLEVVDYACSHRLHRIPVSEPFLGGRELDYVTDCVRSGWVSSNGTYVRRFESDLAAYCGAEHCLAVSNGTAALHLCLEALGIGEGDEVIVPTFTFAASVNAIIYSGATPVLVDCEEATWTMNLDKVEELITEKTKAIMAVHIYSHPCNMKRLQQIAEKNKLLIIEDAAESLGSTFEGKQTGTFGDAAAFSFFGNKVITTGEGGATFFKRREHYERAKILRDHGMRPGKRYWHDQVGFNYRMTNLQAALGCAQLEQLDQFLLRKKEIVKLYEDKLKELKQVEFQPIQAWATSCHWVFTILLNENVSLGRDELIEKLVKNGIETRPTFYPMHMMDIYKQYGEGQLFSMSEKIARRGISLPSAVTLKDEEIISITDCLKSILEVNNEVSTNGY